MNTAIIVAIITLFGAITSVTLSFIISKYQNKIELMKIHSEFSEKLYSKRLEAYLEIYELISGFAKKIKGKRIFYEELNDFYEKYSILDSKSGLLFSYTINSSAELMSEIRKMLSCEKTDDALREKQKGDLYRKLADVELSMKYELGVFMYRNPTTILKEFELPERYKDALAEINGRAKLRGNMSRNHKMESAIDFSD